MDKPFVRPSEILKPCLVQQKAENYFIVIWANKYTESIVYLWVCAHAIFDVTCIPTFVGAEDTISSALSIH